MNINFKFEYVLYRLYKLTMASPTVTDIKVTDLSVSLKGPLVESKSHSDAEKQIIDKLSKLIPTTLVPKRIEFTINGVNNAVSNAIRRTVMCELLTYSLKVEYDSFATNDRFIIPEMLVRRFELIPIDQDVPKDIVFGLDAVNDGVLHRDVKSSEIKIISPGKTGIKKLPFNETFTLFALQPGKFLKVNKITIEPDFGYNFAGHVLASTPVSIAKDQIPYNSYTNTGIPSRLSNPKVWHVGFITNGAMEPKKVVKYACENIIARLLAVQELFYSIKNNEDEYILVVDGESDTIGNLFMRTIIELYPDIRAVTWSSASVGRSITIRIKCDEDITTVLSTSVKHIIRQFNEIKKFFN